MVTVADARRIIAAAEKKARSRSTYQYDQFARLNQVLRESRAPMAVQAKYGTNPR